MVNRMSAILETLAEAFGEDVSPQRAAVYVATLGERYTDAELAGAGRALLLTSRRFPAIADFVEAIEGKRPTQGQKLLDEAADQWAKLMAANPQSPSSKLADHVCRDVTGTMFPAADLSLRDAGFKRRDFVEMYARRKQAAANEDRERLLDEAASGTTRLLEEANE